MELKKITPRINEQTDTFLQGTFRTKNSGAEYIIEAFPALYARTLHSLKGTFQADELRLMLDVFNATALTAGMAGQHLIANCVDGIELDALDKKWGVYKKTFTEKLNALPIFDRACLEIWANGFWYGGDTTKSLDINKHIAPMCSQDDLVKIFCAEADQAGVNYSDITHYIETIQTGRRMSGNDEKTGDFMGRENTFWNPAKHLDYNFFLIHQVKIAAILK